MPISKKKNNSNNTSVLFFCQQHGYHVFRNNINISFAHVAFFLNKKISMAMCILFTLKIFRGKEFSKYKNDKMKPGLSTPFFMCFFFYFRPFVAQVNILSVARLFFSFVRTVKNYLLFIPPMRHNSSLLKQRLFSANKK